MPPRSVLPAVTKAHLIRESKVEDAVLLSLVSVVAGSIAGHILFTRMWIDCDNASIPAAALAPLAVVPEHQRQGFGGCLIEHGHASLKIRGERMAIVRGHPDYYQCFGYSAALARNLDSPFPRESFMAQELTPGALIRVRGKVRYADAFGL